MTKVALALAAFAVITGIYGSARVIPKYKEIDSELFSRSLHRAAPRFNSPEYRLREEMGSERERWRSRSQQYAFGIIGSGLVALVLAIVALRRKQAKGQAIAAIVMALAGFGFVAYFQGMANIF